MKNIFIIDDELQICESIKMILEYVGYNVDYSTSALNGLNLINEKKYAALLLDIQMPDLNGFDVLQKVKKIQKELSVIIISAHGNVENAIKATRLGAFDFIEKPIDREKLIISVRNAVDQSLLLLENIEMKKSLKGSDKILGQSKVIKEIIDLIDKVAPTDARVMINGDNGTGKELVARAIQQNSIRKDAPYIEVNCAAIPNELIESELFGHEKGSFTGAMQQRIGKFELANNGTLFLDEIGDMSLQAQAKVLRAIEDGKIERVGGTKKIEVNVRIISATNKNLEEEIKKGNFREDLFHRLNVIPVNIPPLRERTDDIPILVDFFADEISKKHGKTKPVFSDESMKFLKQQNWTGNVRELRNAVERIIIILGSNQIIEKSGLELLFNKSKEGMDNIINSSNSFQEFKEKAERAFILKQLELNNWNISKTAEILDIQRSHLYSKMKKYEINKEEENG